MTAALQSDTPPVDERTPLLSASAIQAEGASSAEYAGTSDILLARGKPPKDDRAGIDLSPREKFWILAGCTLATFIAAIDMTVTASLLVPIGASFHAAHQASWLGTAFLLANITFTPLFGRLCDIMGRRLANSLAIVLFTVGTALCAVAPNMLSFIVFRFIAGSGGGGLSVTGSVIGTDLMTLQQRGMVAGIQTGIWALGGALGGPFGGWVADTWGWRMAFAVQVPFLLLSLASALLQIRYKVPQTAQGSVREKLGMIDWAGCATLFVTFGSILLSLSLRQNSRLPWSNTWVITTTTVAPVAFVVFLWVEARVAKHPILPFRLLKRQTPLFGMLLTVFVAVSNFGSLYSLPVWFIAVEGASAKEAGAHLLPNSVGNVVGGIGAGYILYKTGLIRVPATIVGLGAFISPLLIASMTPASSTFLQYFCIFPAGLANGFMLNGSTVSMQADCAKKDIPPLMGLLWLFRSTGQVIGVASTSAILQGVLAPALAARITGPGAPELIEQVREDTSIIAHLPQLTQTLVRESYAVALQWVFRAIAVTAFLSWLSSVFIPQLPLDGPRDDKPKPATAEEAARRQA